MVETRNKSDADRVSASNKHNGNGTRGPFRGERYGRGSEDEINLSLHQVGYQRRQTVHLSVCSAVFKRNVMADVEPHFVQTTKKGSTAAVRLTCCAHIDPANYRHRGLLRARHQWPRRRAAESRDERAPPHVRSQAQVTAS